MNPTAMMGFLRQTAGAIGRWPLSRSWAFTPAVVLLLLFWNTGCPQPVDDDAADDDTVPDPCEDFALLVDEVDPARMLDTMAWLISYDRRDSRAVQEEVLDALTVDLQAAGADLATEQPWN